MKKISLFLMVAVSATIFSCQKEKQVTPASPINNSTTLSVPAFDESNSTQVTWDQLPDNLKSATPISLKDNSPSINASYKYFMGTWGGGGGSAYGIYPAGSYDKIFAIAFRSGAYVDAFTVWYVRPNGTLYYYNRGGNGGSYYIQYLSSNEYIYAIGGRSGKFIDRLTIYTNHKSFSYGGNGGSPFFASAAPGDQILGFYGGSGIYIDRIGVYVYSK